MRRPSFLLAILLVALAAPARAQPTSHQQAPAADGVAATAWTAGGLATGVVAPEKLQPLTLSAGGNRIWKSNNPEVIQGTGWLMQNSRTDATRGGAPFPLAGCTDVYAFHINKSGAQRWLHVLVSNPQAAAITVSARGSLYTSAEKPLTGKATGPSHAVARDWLNATPRTTVAATSVASKKVLQVVRGVLPTSAMIDARFEVCASQGAYIYTVITDSGNLTEAIDRSQGTPAAGTIAVAGPNTYGREAGVYASAALTGTTAIEVPAAPAHVGLCFNTSNKFVPGRAAACEQTSPAVHTLTGSAPRTYGNYGHKLDVTLALKNPSATQSRKVRLSFASNHVTPGPSFTYNGPARLNGTAFELYTTPAQARQTLATWTLAPGANFNARLVLYVPGLITTNQQLILESL